MKKLFITLFYFFCTCYFLTSWANNDTEPKQTITWLIEDIKESYPLKSNNISHLTPSLYSETLVLSKLTNFRIKKGWATQRRIDNQIKNTSNTCTANRIITPQRTEYSIFSYPQNIYLSHKLYRLGQSTPLPDTLLNNSGEIISLSKLFKAYSNDILGIADGLSYGTFLDKEIAKLKDENLYRRGSIKRIKALNEMLFKKRIDYILFYPNDIDASLPINESLESYVIEGIEPFIIGYINCSNSALGRKVIADVNQILSQAYTTNDFYDAHTRMLLPVDTLLFNEYFQTVFMPNNTNNANP